MTEISAAKIPPAALTACRGDVCSDWHQQLGVEFPAGLNQDWHPAPKRQLVVVPCGGRLVASVAKGWPAKPPLPTRWPCRCHVGVFGRLAD